VLSKLAIKNAGKESSLRSQSCITPLVARPHLQAEFALACSFCFEAGELEGMNKSNSVACDLEKTGLQNVPPVAEIGREVLTRQRIPIATYRLQFNSNFTFQQAKTLVPYLHDLGISDCYASPLFKARPGSTHGYDIYDYSQLNPELGSEEDFSALSLALQSQGMGLLLDMVPNHMGIAGAGNAWWYDVLEIGPSSVYASYFDIDWQPVKPDLANKVLLPILEDQYGRILESSRFRLSYEDGAFFLNYHENRWPVAPRTYSRILSFRIEDLVQKLGEQNDHVQELQSILTAVNYLPSRTELDPEKIAERIREKEIIKRRLATLYNTCANVRSMIDLNLQIFNGVPGQPRSFDMLDELIDAQPYRPAFWRVATDEINYRRFFDINELAAIRVELPEVFHATHSLIFRLLADGKISGLRIDHPDGLWDPPAYFRKLQEHYLLHSVEAGLAKDSKLDPALQDRLRTELSTWSESAGLQGSSGQTWPLFVVAEKILAEGESLPEDWAVNGTTGYDFLNQVNGLFVDGRNERAFNRLYSQFTRTQVDLGNLINATKKMIMLVSMAGEINALSYLLDRISEKNRSYRDFTLNSLTFAIREVIACLPVYRTYINGRRNPLERDRAYIETAVREAKQRNPRTAHALFDFIKDTLLLRNTQDFREEDREKLLEFVMKFQQLTGPVTAKGVEDTAFYVYNRLVSLNEVGSGLERFGISVESFHKQNFQRRQRWPHSLLATSTHDTKRSEDVRARINVLSEIPGEWGVALKRWSRLNASHKTKTDGKVVPDRNDEYLFYQTLLGAWPEKAMSPEEAGSFRDRMLAYMLKATKEAKVHTSWVNPNEGYDRAVHSFVCAVLDDKPTNLFLKDFSSLQRKIAFYGRLNGLAQVLLKLTVPGIPDIYQGTELWDYSLVDPDNRGAVDYERRQQILEELKSDVERAGQDLVALARGLLESSADGRVKLYLTYRTLNFRRDHADLFSKGDYISLEVAGEKQDHVCAFGRRLDQEEIIVAVPRLAVGLTGGSQQMPLGQNVWLNTRLALPPHRSSQRYSNLFTGESVSTEEQGGRSSLALSAVFRSFPLALLISAVQNSEAV
jgi:(1->4)-alpha-D-glucan 1-alpha-D-glucosylmutase